MTWEQLEELVADGFWFDEWREIDTWDGGVTGEAWRGKLKPPPYQRRLRNRLSSSAANRRVKVSLPPVRCLKEGSDE